MTTSSIRGLQTKLVGVSVYADAVRDLEIGQQLLVEHEPDNAYDANALKVTKENGDTVGYIARDVAKRVIEKDTERAFTAHVINTTTHEGVTVGGFIQFPTQAGYLIPTQTHITKKEDDMSRFTIPDEVTEQGAGGWESDRASKVRVVRLAAGKPITVIPLTDYKTSSADGGWASIREVKAFGGVRIAGEKEPVDLPGRLVVFPVSDFVIVRGRDGSMKRQYATDPLLQRLAPSKYECKKPFKAPDDWEPPKHTKPKDVTYVNCVFIEGQLHEGDKANYNPKPGDHILLGMATSWYEDWKRLMERDRKKNKDYSPAGRRWTLKISGSFQDGNLAFHADDEIGEPIPLPDPINLQDWAENKRAEVEAWVNSLDGVTDIMFNPHQAEPEDDDVSVEEDDEAITEFEEAVASSDSGSDGHDWSEEVPARLKKMLTAIGVKVAPTAKKDELIALATEHEDALLEFMNSAAA